MPDDAVAPFNEATNATGATIVVVAEDGTRVTLPPGRVALCTRTEHEHMPPLVAYVDERPGVDGREVRLPVVTDAAVPGHDIDVVGRTGPPLDVDAVLAHVVGTHTSALVVTPNVARALRVRYATGDFVPEYLRVPVYMVRRNRLYLRTHVAKPDEESTQFAAIAQ